MEIKLENVNFSYKKVNYEEKEIFKNISIKFKKDKINGIIGANGSGKSTLAGLLNKSLINSSGKITYDGININKIDVSSLHFNVGLISQSMDDIFLNKTVKEELAYYIKLYNYRMDEMDKRIINSLKMVGLDGSYLDRNPLNLSSSEKRKLIIATVLINNPKVLIFDEPLIGLDLNSKKEIKKLIRLLKNRYKKTIIIISNDIDFIHEIVDYVYVLGDKKVILEGNKFDVFKEGKILKKYNIKIPKIIEFSNKVLNKKEQKIGYRDDINDLIKDIYRSVK